MRNDGTSESAYTMPSIGPCRTGAYEVVIHIPLTRLFIMRRRPHAARGLSSGGPSPMRIFLSRHVCRHYGGFGGLYTTFYPEVAWG